MEIVLTVVSYLVAGAVGAFVWTKISPYITSLLAARAKKNAVSSAQKLLAAEQAHAAAVASAHAVVAAAAVTSATGPTGTTAVSAPTAGPTA